MKTYQLEVNEAQAKVLAAALDLYARVGTGQFETLLDHPTIQSRTFLTKSSKSSITMEQFRSLLQTLKRELFDLVSNAYHSISSNEIGDENRVAYDLYQVIKHRTSWDKAGNPPERTKEMFGVWYDTPRQTSTQQPLPKMQAVVFPED